MSKGSIFDRMVDALFFTIYPRIRKPTIKARVNIIDKKFRQGDDIYAFDTFVHGEEWLSYQLSFINSLLRDEGTSYKNIYGYSYPIRTAFNDIEEFSKWLEFFVSGQELNIDALDTYREHSTPDKKVSTRSYTKTPDKLQAALTDIAKSLDELIKQLKDTDLSTARGEMIHRCLAYTMTEMVPIYCLLRKHVLNYNPLVG